MGCVDDAVVASVTAGYDGHRGWVNYLSVSPAQRRQGRARHLVQQVEALLLARGCPKPNLQVRSANTEAFDFYRHLGYLPDDVVSLGRRLIPDGLSA